MSPVWSGLAAMGSKGVAGTVHIEHDDLKSGRSEGTREKGTRKNSKDGSICGVRSKKYLQLRLLCCVWFVWAWLGWLKEGCVVGCFAVAP